MKKIISNALAVFILGITVSICAQEGGALSIDAQPVEKESAVTAVYGVTADDYLPAPESRAENKLNPKVRGGGRQSFDLPDAFYFIGGPIFILILLRVLVIFLNGFEEKRKEEENQMASEQFNPD